MEHGRVVTMAMKQPRTRSRSVPKAAVNKLLVRLSEPRLTFRRLGQHKL
jgi:hypothetical protein